MIFVIIPQRVNNKQFYYFPHKDDIWHLSIYQYRCSLTTFRKFLGFSKRCWIGRDHPDWLLVTLFCPTSALKYNRNHTVQKRALRVIPSRRSNGKELKQERFNNYLSIVLFKLKHTQKDGFLHLFSSLSPATFVKKIKQTFIAGYEILLTCMHEILSVVILESNWSLYGDGFTCTRWMSKPICNWDKDLRHTLPWETGCTG